MAGHRAVRRETQEIRRRQKVIKYIALVSVAHFAMDRRTQVAVIVAVAGLAAPQVWRRKAATPSSGTWIEGEAIAYGVKRP